MKCVFKHGYQDEINYDSEVLIQQFNKYLMFSLISWQCLDEKLLTELEKKIDLMPLVLGKLWSLCASSGSGHKSANYTCFVLDMSALLFICLLLRSVALNCRVCGQCSSFRSNTMYNERLCETCSCYQLVRVFFSGFFHIFTIVQI